MPAPSNLTVAATTANRVGLTWVNNATNSFGTYVERSDTADFSAKVVFACGAGVNSYSDGNLPEGTVYYYRICSYGIVATSDYSEVVAATTRLKLPTDLTATAESPMVVILKWRDNSQKERGYLVEKRGDDGVWSAISEELAANTQTYVDRTCEAGKTYGYRVVVLGLTSETSGAVEVTTPIVEAIDPQWIGPVSTDHLPAVYGVYDVTATDRYVYAVSGGVLNIYTVLDGDRVPAYHSHVPLSSPFGVAAMSIEGEDYAFVTDESNLKIIKPSDQSFMRVVALPGYGYRLACDGKLVYVACGAAGVAVIDVSNPSTPKLISNGNTSGVTQAWSVDVKGAVAVVANGTEGVAVLDAANPANLKLFGKVKLPGYWQGTFASALDVAVENGMAWVAGVNDGLIQVDISSPRNPAWVRTVTTTGPATGVCVDGSYVFVACNNGVSTRTGIDIFGCGGGSLEKLVFMQTLGTASYRVAVHDRSIYLTDNWYLVDVAKY